MDSSDITRQVVSPMPELFSYWSEPADGRDFSRFINDQIAALVALIDVIGDDRIMVGPDYPFVIQDSPPGLGLSELNPMSDVADMIRSRNAQTFLGQAS